MAQGMVSSTPDRAEFWKVPTSFAIWGGLTGDRAQLALAIARRIDPEPFWLQVEGPGTLRDRREAALIAGLPRDHLFILDPTQHAAQGDTAATRTRLATNLASADDHIRVLSDFLRLPAVYQRLMAGRQPLDPVKAVVAANVDRPRPLWPSSAGSLRPYIEAINEFAYTVIFTLWSRPDENGRDLDYVFRLEDGAETRSRVQVTCESGSRFGTPGLFSIGEQHDLLDFVLEIGRA